MLQSTKSHPLVLAIALILACPALVAGNLKINLIYGVGFDGPNSVVHRRVVRAAADYWEAVILTDFEVEITANQVDLSPIGGGVLGRMHSNTETGINPVTMTRLPESAFIEIASNRIDDFYFDDTPYDSVEYMLDNRGVGTSLAGTPGEFLFDALTIWIHEIGHVMGFSGASGTFSDGMPYLAYTDFANNLSGNLYEFDWLQGGLEGSSGDVANMFNAFHISESGANGWVASMNPFAITGLRKLITPIDSDIVADAFHLQVDELALPILGDVNCDGSINLLDVDPFVASLSAKQYLGKADVNGDGANNLLDVAPFVELIGN